MAKLNLGRVAFVLRGEWAQGAYNKLDVVSYGTTGDSYVSRVDNNTALPTDDTKWLRLTNVGDSVAAANQAAQAANTAAESATAAAASSVRTDTDQALNDTQKSTARGNIDAASVGEVSDLKSALEQTDTRMSVLYAPIYGKNLCDPSAIVSGKYIDWTNGNEASSDSYVASGYIPVIKGALYGFTGVKSHFAFYDSNKKYVSETTANDVTELSGGSVTVTSGSAPGQFFVSPIDGYIRYSMNASTVPVGRRVFMAIHSSTDLVGTTYPTYTDAAFMEPVERQRVIDIEADIDALEDEVDDINENLADLFLTSPNLLNTEAITDGYYLTNTGALQSNSVYITSDYIPCAAGDTIRYQFDYRGNRYDNTSASGYTKMRFIAAYDSSKTYISSSYATNQTSYVCPTNTAFVRISFTKSAFNTGDFSNAAIIISNLSNVVPYYPYGAILGFKERIDAYLPADIYCAVGRTIELYNNQVCLQADEYHVQWVCTIGKALKRKFSITGTNDLIGTYNLSVTIYNDDSIVLWSAATTLHIVAELDLQSTYSICPIGDSLTNSKRWMPEVMNLSGDAVSFVGTYSATAQDSDGVNKSFHHEGRSGFSAYNYIAGSPYTFGGATETPHNKFWDGTAFSWSHYKTTYSINPDAVMVWLGTNGITLDNTANAGYIKQLVDIIRADDASIPIYVCNTIYRGNQNGLGEQTASDGYAANKGQWNYQEKQKVMNLMKILDGLLAGYENVTLINLALSHDSEYNYGAVVTPVNPRASQTELMPIEATHPQAQGYFQIADIVYSVLSATIS